MSTPRDYFGVELKVGQTVVYVGAGYTQFCKDTVTKVSAKTVTLGDKSQWGSYTRRPFNSVIVVDEIERLEKQEEKLLALEAAGVDNWDGYSWAMEELSGDDDE